MLDPDEGIDEDGCIRTGVHHDRIQAPFDEVVATAARMVTSRSPEASLYLYGSVATGSAVPGSSDVDLLAIDLDTMLANEMSRELSSRFGTVARSVDIGSGSASDFSTDPDDDERYGNGVFLRHYCIQVAGPGVPIGARPFPADRRAARGFNGDIARHAAQWRDAVGTTEPADLGRRMARKTLLAVAGLVSVHDGTWTTDRATAARRWSTHRPALAPSLDELSDWSDGRARATTERITVHLEHTVDLVVQDFSASIGLWAH